MSRNDFQNVKMSQICRVCLRSDDTLRPASESTIPRIDAPPIAVIQLWQLFNETLTTQEAGFPDKLCSDCFHELQNAYLFMLKCEKADAILKQIKQIHFHLNTHFNGINNNEKLTYVKHSSKDEDEISTDLDVKDEFSSNDFDIEINDDESISDSSDLDIEIKDDEQTNDSYTSNINLNIRKKDPDINSDSTPMNVDSTAEINELTINPATEKLKQTKEYIKTYKCPRCSYTCIHSANLQRHIFRRHVENIAEDDDEEQTKCKIIDKDINGENHIINIDSESENNDFILTPLPPTYQQPTIPTTELAKPETTFQATTPEDTVSQEKIPHFVKYVNRDGKMIKIWECGICSRNFQHQYTLMRHLPTHTNERNFICDECGKAFRQLSTLSQHRAIHSVERPYACETCNKSFNRISTLISHRKTHSEIKPFRCPMCHKGFHQKGNLRNHIYIHTNERPYRCPVCDKGFNQMSNLVCHSQKSHSTEFGSIWTCHRCNMTFSKRTLLRAHELETHHIQGASAKSNTQNQLPNGGRKLSTSSSFDDSNKSSDLDGGSGENSKSEIFQNGILIPAIDTEAMKIAKINKEMPFAVLHFFEGPPLLVRIVDYGTQSLLRPTKNEDFISLKSQQSDQAEKVCVPIVAAVYQTLNVAGLPEFKVMPPKNIYKFSNQQALSSTNCDSKNDTKTIKNQIQPEFALSDFASLTTPQIPSDVAECLGAPMFDELINIKDESPQLDDNTMEAFTGIFEEKEQLQNITEESNWWNRQSKIYASETIEFSDNFLDIDNGKLLTPTKIETNMVPDRNSSILDISQSRNPLLSQGESQISNARTMDYLDNLKTQLTKYDGCQQSTIEFLYKQFLKVGMGKSFVDYFLEINPDLASIINKLESSVLKTEQE